MMKNQTIKYIILEQLLTENRVTQTKERWKCVPPAFIDHLSQKDPSGNNKYLDWMTKQLFTSDDVNSDYSIKEVIGDNYPKCVQNWAPSYDSDFFSNYENLIRRTNFEFMINEIINIVKDFNRFGKNLKNKDINSYGYTDLSVALEPYITKSKEKELAKDVERVYEDEDWLIISPKSYAASCTYGANTKWCVTMKHTPQYYERYTKEDFYLLFVIKKKENKKWAINTELKLSEPAEDIVVNLPWSKQVSIGDRPSVKNNVGVARERFRPRSREEERSFSQLQRQYHRNTTTYWDAEDNQIDWSTFIKESNLPGKLQSLLKAVEKKVIINVAKKKRGEIPYEVNQNPIRLKKNDKVKLLASGYGYYRGDEGIVIATYSGASGRQKDLTVSDAGYYMVHVPGRKTETGNEGWVGSGETRRRVPYVVINGAYLQKIVEPKVRKSRNQ